MEAFLKNIASQSEVIIDAKELKIDDRAADRCYMLISPRELEIEVSSRETAAKIILAHCNSGEAKLTIRLKDGAKLSIVEYFGGFASGELDIKLGRDAECNITSVRTAGGNTLHNIDFEGEGSNLELNVLQLTEDGEYTKYRSNVRHLTSHCNSQSLTKSVSSGCSTIEFHGLVYVATDAQQTNADQSSRNIEMGELSKILVEPQLEIYADDVKCSHGATVGQLNGDAIWYMRQRGLSKEQAQRVQLEGFAMDVVSKCSIPSLSEELMRVVEAKLLKM